MLTSCVGSCDDGCARRLVYWACGVFSAVRNSRFAFRVYAVVCRPASSVPPCARCPRRGNCAASRWQFLAFFVALCNGTVVVQRFIALLLVGVRLLDSFNGHGYSRRVVVKATTTLSNRHRPGVVTGHRFNLAGKIAPDCTQILRCCQYRCTIPPFFATVLRH